MRDAVIVSAVRTAVGKAPKGTLRSTRPDDLAAFAIKGAMERVPQLDAKEVEAVVKMLGLDPAVVNVNGGAIALGHPLGCTGAKLTASLLQELKRRSARYGMVTMCVGGGMGATGIFENLNWIGGWDGYSSDCRKSKGRKRRRLCN
jgi:acetyl-CoA acetyltransferase